MENPQTPNRHQNENISASATTPGSNSNSKNAAANASNARNPRTSLGRRSTPSPYKGAAVSKRIYSPTGASPGSGRRDSLSASTSMPRTPGASSISAANGIPNRLSSSNSKQQHHHQHLNHQSIQLHHQQQQQQQQQHPAVKKLVGESIQSSSTTSGNKGKQSLQNQSGLILDGQRLGAIIYSPRKLKQKVKSYDRFIPNRHAMDNTSAHFHLKEFHTPSSNSGLVRNTPGNAGGGRPSNSSTSNVPAKKPLLDQETIAYQEVMARACGVALDRRILKFAVDPPPSDRHDLRASWNRPVRPRTAMTKRRIPLAPERILDAPGLADDFYLNLLDWSSKNILAVGLEDTVYIWNGDTGAVQEFCKTTRADDYIASLKWASDGSYLAVGTGNGDAQIWDMDTTSKIRSMKGHTSRVGVMSWDQHILSSGTRDGSIWNHDVRVANHKIMEFDGHESEVCGMAWRPDGALLASGGNDNMVHLWDARSSRAKMSKGTHQAAVKALAWCPWQLNLLATGGGSQDATLNFWNTTTSSLVNSINTGSQITSIQWSISYKELVTSHGFPDNQLSIWSYPALNKIADLPGHDARILSTVLSPDGETIVSSASDENLKFWKVFERQKGSKDGKKVNNGEIPSGGGGGNGNGGGKKNSNLEMDDDLLTSYTKMTIR